MGQYSVVRYSLRSIILVVVFIDYSPTPYLLLWRVPDLGLAAPTGFI
jgi:hypothetical protein